MHRYRVSRNDIYTIGEHLIDQDALYSLSDIDIGRFVKEVNVLSDETRAIIVTSSILLFAGIGLGISLICVVYLIWSASI